MYDQLTENFAGLNEAVKQYIKARIDLVKLLLLKKTSNYMSLLFGLLIVILFLSLITAFACTAFVLWYGQTYGSYLNGVYWAMGGLTALLLLFLLLRKRILTSLFINKASSIIFEEEEDEAK